MDASFSPPDLPDRYADFLASPEQYVDSVKSCLHSFGGPNANYDDLFLLVPFLIHLNNHYMENQNGVVRRLFDHGLLAILLDFTFQTPWSFADPDEDKVRESYQVKFSFVNNAHR